MKILLPSLSILLLLSAAAESAKLNKAELRLSIERGMRRIGIPGMAVAVLYKNELIFAEAFGKRNKNDPYTIHVSEKDTQIETTNNDFFFLS